MERLPTLEEILSNPAFTEAEKNEARAMFAKFDQDIAEKEAELQQRKSGLRMIHTEALELASRGIPLSKTLLASIAEAGPGTKPDAPKPKTEPEEITW